jgi:hypothetical protein
MKKVVISLTVVITTVVLAVVWYVALPMLWQPVTQPDSNQDECRDPPGKRVPPTHYTDSWAVVTIIRLTDDGEFANRCDLRDAIYEIRNYRKPQIIVWYIHGWKHNADKDNTDLRKFKKLISELDEQQRQLDEKERRRVVGVYVGWDGAVGPAPLQGLTFWNRKRAADRISQSSVVTKIFAATKYAREQVGREITAKDLTIMIGHSFGARILYTATSQVLIDEVQRRHPGNKFPSYQKMTGPADLIVLLNPAFEASIFTVMHSIRRPDAKEWEGINRRQQPLLLAISTENDSATEKLFPLGQSLEFGSCQDIKRDRSSIPNRCDRQRETLGNHKEYFTHRLKAVTPSEGSPTNTEFWYDRFATADLVLLRTANRQPGNPFLVARTTPNIINEHNGIWGPELRKWMVSFMLELDKRRAGAGDQPSLVHN